MKPANILLTPAGAPKITDFGLAKQIDAEGGHTQSGAILGTPSYMAPEQAAGKSKLIGPATDVYALGTILYEMLTGRTPFRGGNPMDVVLQVLTKAPEPPSRLQATIPPILETICLKCLVKKPKERYPSALALANELQGFLDGAAPSTPAPAAPDRGGERTGTASMQAAAGTGGVLGGTPRTEAEARKSAIQKPPPGPTIKRSSADEEVTIKAPPRSAPRPKAKKEAPSPAGYNETGSQQVHRWVLVSALVAVALVGAAGSIWWFTRSTPPEQDLTQVDPKVVPGPVVPPPPSPPVKVQPASFQVDKLGPVTFKPGESRQFTVKVARQNYAGPIAVTLAGMPAKVFATAMVLPKDQETCQLEVRALPDAAPGAFEGKVQAQGDGVEGAAIIMVILEKAAQPPPIKKKDEVIVAKNDSDKKEPDKKALGKNEPDKQGLLPLDAEPGEQFSGFVFSSDGQQVAAYSRTVTKPALIKTGDAILVGASPRITARITVWQTATGKVANSFPVSNATLNRPELIGFVDKDRSLAVSFLGSYQVFNVKGLAKGVNLPPPTKGYTRSYHLISPDGRYLAFVEGSDLFDPPPNPLTIQPMDIDSHAFQRYMIRIWDLAAEKQLGFSKLVRKPPQLEFSPNSREVVCRLEQTLLWWDIQSGKDVNPLVKSAKGLGQCQTRLVVSQGTIRCGDGTALLEIDAKTGKELGRHVLAPGGGVAWLAPNGKWAVVRKGTPQNSTELICFDVKTRQEHGQRKHVPGIIQEGAFSADGRLFVFTASRGAPQVWKIEE